VTETTIPARGCMAELARYFLRLGRLGFGGPVALVGEVMP
jgi:chromate transporter